MDFMCLIFAFHSLVASPSTDPADNHRRTWPCHYYFSLLAPHLPPYPPGFGTHPIGIGCLVCSLREKKKNTAMCRIECLLVELSLSVFFFLLDPPLWLSSAVEEAVVDRRNRFLASTYNTGMGFPLSLVFAFFLYIVICVARIQL